MGNDEVAIILLIWQLKKSLSTVDMYIEDNL